MLAGLIATSLAMGCSEGSDPLAASPEPWYVPEGVCPVGEPSPLEPLSLRVVQATSTVAPASLTFGITNESPDEVSITMRGGTAPHLSVVVRDPSGILVWTSDSSPAPLGQLDIDLAAGATATTPVRWEAEDSAGTRAPDGTYCLRATAEIDGFTLQSRIVSIDVLP